MQSLETADVTADNPICSIHCVLNNKLKTTTYTMQTSTSSAELTVALGFAFLTEAAVVLRLCWDRAIPTTLE